MSPDLKNKFLERWKEILNQYPEEIPSFTWIIQNEKLISEAYNFVESSGLSSLHSEILAIEAAQKELGSRYLTNCELYTIIEPCLMCSGAIGLSRIKKVVYFAESQKEPGISSFDLENIYSKNHFPSLEYFPQPEVQNILRNFFKPKRKP